MRSPDQWPGPAVRVANSAAPQRAAWQHVQGRLDGLGREAFPHVVRRRATEASGNRLGRAPSGQVRLDIPPQPGIQEFAWPPRRPRPCRRRRVGGASPIGVAPRRVPGRLTADRAGRPPQHRGHGPQRIALGQSQAQSLTFFDTHVRIVFLWHGKTFAHPGR
jgi:hypothetical protein